MSAALSLAVRWLLANGPLSIRTLILLLGMLAISAAFWIDYRAGHDSVGLLTLFVLLFGLLPLAGLVRVLVFQPDQLPFLRQELLLCALALPCGISCGICLFCTLRRSRRGSHPDDT